MDKHTVLQVGGSLERAVKGEYNLDMRAILKEAWQQTLKSRISINLGLLFIYILGLGLAFALGEYFGGLTQLISSIEIGNEQLVIPDDVGQKINVIFMVVAIVQCPLFAGVDMMGVLHSVGIKTKASMIFAFFKRSSWVILCSLLSSVLIQLGMVLIIPGIFLAVSLTLVIPLVIEKRMTPMKAIWLCIQATRFQWFKIAGLYLILAGAFSAACLPLLLMASSGAAVIGVMIFLFAFTYLAPLFFNVKGILYREIFGMQLQSKNAQQGVVDDIFNA